MSISAITTSVPIYPPSPPTTSNHHPSTSGSVVSSPAFFGSSNNTSYHPHRQQSSISHHHHPYYQPGTGGGGSNSGTPSLDSAASCYASPSSPYHLGSPPTSPTDPASSPLTLQERRMRNKAASAKYRQKKNQQQYEMRQTICRLTEQKTLLERKLEEYQCENERLRSTVDRLRGKLEAKRMLRRWVRQNRHQKDTPTSAFHAVSLCDEDDIDDLDLDDRQ
ncbi:hypothetical protein O0I10_004472 [Lichtheimia ornata]|uniref:BZIP domain-containing protein n=1 Tax=Lichtheimia ornata TaxID=688661 RepID=A0AAD7V6K9_9FUNG|nr:uncharacterized protein O0I10_004472 [Lichtheimia ornata]KAJ8659879.1 hypothetical protein O0I10_004472 [Lichtheimia ornata]